MSFPKGFLDELKGRIRVSDVVGRKVKLRRQGREFIGLSPFSNEKSPSFTVNDDKQFFHCFSSGEHGDVIKFLEKTENLSFIEAVERLAAEAGMEMPERDPFVAEREKEAATLIDVMEMAAQFFRQKLQEGAGAEARAYLERRGMKAKTLDDFGVGYAPGDERADRTALMRYLKSRDVTMEQMAEAGLIISGPDIREPHDRFRNRVMFPIADARGRVIAFGGRALASDAKAKYLNSPDTPLFHKGRVLYNLNRARKPAYDEGTVIAVEGYMDVIGLSQGGIDNAVAPLGTALTEDQIALLWRMAPEPILCFDGDKAGLRAAYRAVERVLPLLKPGHSLRFALLPEGKDPDDLVREEGGQAVRDILAKARPLAEMVWEKEISAGQWDTPERRAKLEADLEAAVATIADPKVRGHYSDNLRAKVQQFFGGSARGGQRGGFGQNRFSRGQPGRPFRKGTFNRDRDYIPPVTPELRRSALASGGGGERSREGLLLLTLLNHPELLENYAEEVSRVEIGTPALDRLRNEIIDIAALHAPLEREALRNHLLSRDLAEIARRLEAGQAFKSDPFAWPDAAPDEAEAGFLHTLARHRRVIVLEAELKAAERALAEEMTEENFARLQAIHAQLERSELADGLG
ncbi:DNA primase [Parvibaculum sp.]|uniref:DNA primase n=1 Tax=Parvibaculum sp. TaxID=2024848 RepID=UPI00272FC124|nr:DNA primase [Parvibaculum sp.]MDP1626935.1 DNA primase [Parvibaculum sp.]MDP2151669.1 DNA primase [Parvibaculum sp.]MDP3328946.1 DNA primase [Parvibaculum sp.]